MTGADAKMSPFRDAASFAGAWRRGRSLVPCPEVRFRERFVRLHTVTAMRLAITERALDLEPPPRTPGDQQGYTSEVAFHAVDNGEQRLLAGHAIQHTESSANRGTE
jgi:hypothetical protein